MSDFSDVGKLMYLPLEDIELETKFSAPEFLVNAAAEAVINAGGRNWQPLLVKETQEYHYQVVCNPVVYLVAKKAKLERVWCIVIDPKPENIEQAKILAGETKPRVNLNTASKETITAALKYLVQTSGTTFKTLDLNKAVTKLTETNRESWQTFDEIVKLKCGITKTKLPNLEQIFFLAPLPKIKIPAPPKIISIKKASREQIFERLNYLYTYKIDSFDTIDPDKTADIIFTATKTKWKSLNPITNLDCGINKTKIKTLKTVFTL